MANNSFPAEFIRDNLAIQTNVIHAAWKAGVQRLLFLGSSCIYPKLAPQPMKEICLLTGPLEPTNRTTRWPSSPAWKCAGATTASTAPATWRPCPLAAKAHIACVRGGLGCPSTLFARFCAKRVESAKARTEPTTWPARTLRGSPGQRLVRAHLRLLATES